MTWNLTKLNRLLKRDRRVENLKELAQLKVISPGKAKLLASFQSFKGLKTASFSQRGLHINIDRKTGCFNAGDRESKGKIPVEPAVLKGIKELLGKNVTHIELIHAEG